MFFQIFKVIFYGVFHFLKKTACCPRVFQGSDAGQAGVERAWAEHLDDLVFDACAHTTARKCVKFRRCGDDESALPSSGDDCPAKGVLAELFCRSSDPQELIAL